MNAYMKAHPEIGKDAANDVILPAKKITGAGPQTMDSALDMWADEAKHQLELGDAVVSMVIAMMVSGTLTIPDGIDVEGLEGFWTIQPREIQRPTLHFSVESTLWGLDIERRP